MPEPKRASRLDDVRVLVVIPAYNEEASVSAVISEIRESLPDATPLVIDDGSRDRTADVALASGARVIRLPFNLGIGGAVGTGFRVAASEGFDVVLQLDGDGQHPAGAGRSLVNELLTSDANYVVGSRFVPGGRYRTSRARLRGIRVLARIVSLLIHQPVTDTTSGLRAADKQAIALFADHYPHDYPEVEAMILARRAGLRIHEVPVDMRPRVTGRSSITPLRSLYYMIKVILAILVQRMERPPVLKARSRP
jgi:glycosyltransferase involved in cell wall biosynthesis